MVASCLSFKDVEKHGVECLALLQVDTRMIADLAPAANGLLEIPADPKGSVDQGGIGR